MATERKTGTRKGAQVAEAVPLYSNKKSSSVLKVVKRPENQLTLMEKLALVEKGISKESLESLKAMAGLDYDQLAQVLNVARATLINKKSPDKFNTDLSDKIMSLADIFSFGFEVFEDQDHFRKWLQSPLQALGGKKPFDLLHSSFGREEVRNLIGRIEHGVYS
jgi:putative toxin-antitoxin system antitoxin component (TIGR02293 family)